MKTSLLVQNKKCGGCAHNITSKLSTIENISDLEVDVEKNKVSFNYLNETDIFKVKQKLKYLGYPSLEENNTSISKAKSFLSCATGKISK